MCFPIFSNVAAGFPSPITSYGPLLLQFSLFVRWVTRNIKYYLTKLHYEVIMLLHHFEELNLWSNCQIKETPKVFSDKIKSVISLFNVSLFLSFLVKQINTVLLGRVVNEIVKMQSGKTSELEKVRQGVKACAVLFPLLGLTWVFGILSVTDAGLVFQYIFTILNSLQVLQFFYSCYYTTSHFRESEKIR